MFLGLPGNSGHKLHSLPEQTDSTEYLLCARGFSRSWKEELTKWTKSCHGIYVPVIQGIGPKPKLPGESEARAEFWKLRRGKKKDSEARGGKDGRCDDEYGGGGQMQFQKVERMWATVWSCEIL